MDTEPDCQAVHRLSLHAQAATQTDRADQDQSRTFSSYHIKPEPTQPGRCETVRLVDCFEMTASASLLVAQSGQANCTYYHWMGGQRRWVRSIPVELAITGRQDLTLP